MRTIALTLAYDGTRYVGWQRQSTGVSIQALIEAAVLAIEGKPVTVTGAGRTDAGVHAVGQTASFPLEHSMPLDTLVRAVNARLPEDVRALGAVEREPSFDARFSAVSKTYRYAIATGPIADPFDGRFVWHVPQPLDVDAMSAAIRHLEGTHDYAAFQAAGSEVATTTRTLSRVDCTVVTAVGDRQWRPVATHGDRLVVTIAGSGFLRHMVRNIVGTAVEIALGRRPVADVARLLACRDRSRAGPTAPAHGLCLVRVDYPPGRGEAARPGDNAPGTLA